jgi:hypothetical protein
VPLRTDIATALKAGGLLVAEHPGWLTRGSSDFDPYGVMCHHTAGPAQGDAPSLNVCINGRSDLPGPLANIVLARSGVCHVIAAGRANHAGAGSWQGVTGNRRYFGIEAENTGVGEPWPAGQVDAYVKACAVLLKLVGRDESWCVGHKEYAPTRKIDPAGLDMGWFRVQVKKAIAGEPSEDDMTQEEKVVLADGWVRDSYRRKNPAAALVETDVAYWVGILTSNPPQSTYGAVRDFILSH